MVSIRLKDVISYWLVGFSRRLYYIGYLTVLFNMLFVGNVSMSAPFSFIEIQQIPSFSLQNPLWITATDSCQLAYYVFMPERPRAVVIFYNGAGLYGNSIHQWIGKELADKHSVAVYIVDIRGHGNSGGKRGDAPTIEAVWADISAMVDHVHGEHLDLPLYLAGHSSGAGLLLNYGAWSNHRNIAGLILLAPYLGPMSGALKDQKDPTQRFVKKLRTWVYIIAGISNGYLCAHTPAVYFNYPDSILKDSKILQYYTYTMSLATTPYKTKEIFEAITVPTTLFIASHDEQFIPNAIAQYADYIPQAVYRYSEIVNAKHLSILLQAPDLIAKSIDLLPG